METLTAQLENNSNFNGGGLAFNVTGRYESNRHAIAKIEKATFGEASKFLKTKKGGNLEISANQLLSVYRSVNGEPEWHHAGFLPKSYGGGMKKTYFLNEIPTKEIVLKWLKKYSKNNTRKIKRNFEQKVLQDKKNEFLKIHSKPFNRSIEIPNFSVNVISEMNGKYGWFESDNKYKLTEYFSGYNFESEILLNQFNEIN